jgi:galactokinase
VIVGWPAWPESTKLEAVIDNVDQASRVRLEGSVSGEDPFLDAATFCDEVALNPFFTARSAITVARAPGRLDVLGGIADYSGSLVLELPLAAGALAAAQLQQDGSAVALSGGRRISLSLAELLDVPLAELAARFDNSSGWAAYVLGPVSLFLREERIRVPGLRILISSAIPEARGLGSSAAVGVAAVQAVAGCLGGAPDPRRLALLSQRAEQTLAGAPCGSMDQMTAAYGERDHLLLLLCRPAELVRPIRLPPPLAVWGIDSGVRHAVRGAAYRRARCAAFMGKALLGLSEEYLTAVEPASVDPTRLPEQLTGSEFLASHGGIDDPACEIEPEASYPVRAATVFPLEEHRRVRTFSSLLDRPVAHHRAQLLGDLMYQSHAGYTSCGLGSRATDDLVEAVCRAGWEQGLAGARASAGGAGGTVVVLGHEDAEPLVREIAARLGAGFLEGSSSGAASFGVRTVSPDRPHR